MHSVLERTLPFRSGADALPPATTGRDHLHLPSPLPTYCSCLELYQLHLQWNTVTCTTCHHCDLHFILHCTLGSACTCSAFLPAVPLGLMHSTCLHFLEWEAGRWNSLFDARPAVSTWDCSTTRFSFTTTCTWYVHHQIPATRSSHHRLPPPSGDAFLIFISPAPVRAFLLTCLLCRATCLEGWEEDGSLVFLCHPGIPPAPACLQGITCLDSHSDYLPVLCSFRDAT